jgi:hypothetical protein
VKGAPYTACIATAWARSPNSLPQISALTIHAL